MQKARVDFQEDDGVVNSSTSISLRFGIQALEYSNLGEKGMRETDTWDPGRI